MALFVSVKLVSTYFWWRSFVAAIEVLSEEEETGSLRSL